MRAIGLLLEERGRAQVSTNVHDHRVTPLRDVVEAVRARAPRSPRPSWWGWRRRRPSSGFPADVPLRGFAPERHLLENALRSIS